ncbi:MAG: hypothetical protein ABMA64_17285 [Myxococcota bacterium]
MTPDALRAIAARARELPPGRWSAASLGFGALVTPFAREVGADRVELWVVPRGDQPRWLEGTPGFPESRWLVGVDGQVTLEIGPALADRHVVRRGDVVRWEVDRDLFGYVAPGRWVGLVASRGRSRELPALLAPLAEPLVAYAGAGNVAYVLAAAAVAAAVRDPTPFVAATAFAPYAALAVGRARGYGRGRVVRDGSLFALVAAATLVGGWVAASPGVVSATVVAAGLAVVGSAVTAEAQQLRAWVGVSIALIGMGLAPELGRAWPWLVPGHLCAGAVWAVARGLRDRPAIGAAGTRDRHPPG